MKKTRTEVMGWAETPHKLDRRNVDYLPEIVLPKMWLE
jgi:hypothetical protein